VPSDGKREKRLSNFVKGGMRGQKSLAKGLEAVTERRGKDSISKEENKLRVGNS